MQKLSIVRPINLIIIALNIAIVDFFISQGNVWDLGRVSILILKMLVMVLLAGGANAINDYFDQKTDAINRPEKQVVGKSMSPKNAIRLHLVLTSVAIVLAFLLTLSEHRLFYVIVALGYSIVLYFYTPFLKRIPIVGNLTIACCVAFLPIWSVDGWSLLTPLQLSTLLWLVSFAFLSNLIREWVKDVQDGKGDSNQGYQTAPVRWGLEISVKILKVMWWMLTVLALAYCLIHSSWLSWLSIFLPQLLGWFPLWIAKSDRDMARISWILKLNMVLGMMGILINYLWLSGSWF
jgi:4-hydroxybenzoate polyprenyltransferase